MTELYPETLVVGPLEKKPLYGWFSSTALTYFGASIYQIDNGRSVIVTEISYDPNYKSSYMDALPCGELGELLTRWTG